MVIIAPGNTHTITHISHIQTHSIDSSGRGIGRRRDLYKTKHNTHKTHLSMSPTGIETAIPASQRTQTYFLRLLLFVSAIFKSNQHEKDLSCTYTLCVCFVWFSVHSHYFPIVEEGAPSACRQCSSRALFPVQRQDNWESPTAINL
jgi:hypothetical protein